MAVKLTKEQYENYVKMMQLRKANSVPVLEYSGSKSDAPVLSKVIGIISYFPPDIKEERRKRCFKLLSDVKELFDLPTIVIAQNWTNKDCDDAEKLNDKLDIRRFGKLGIVGARDTLRTAFLNSNFDYLIMLDDDSDIKADEGGIENYLKEIDEHPGMFGLFKYSFLRLAAVSKEAYSLLDFSAISNLSPEAGQIWEDHCYLHTFANLYFDKMFRFSRYHLDEVSIYSQHDPYSIWYNGQNQSYMACVSDKVIEKWVEKEKSKNGN